MVVTLLSMTAVFSAVLAVSGVSAAAERPDEAFSRLYFGIQPPVSRDAERAVELIEELLEGGRYGEAAPLIADRLESREDQLDGAGLGLRKRLVEAVQQTGGDAVRALWTVLGGAYERRLEEAATIAALRELVAAYPAEVFGVEALVSLAEAEVDRGAFATADAAYGAALAASRDAGRDELHAQLARRAEANRGRLPRKLDEPNAEIQLGETLLAARRTAERQAPASWLAAGGDARRLATATGSAPHPTRSWRIGIDPGSSEDPGSEVFASGASVAADGLLVCRVANDLLAIETTNGKRVWKVRLPSGSSSRRRDDEFTCQGISSDTRLVFAVSGSVAGRDLPRRANESNRFGRRRGHRREPNALVAFELATGGKVRWRLDGGDPGGPLEGAVFLGPPAVSECDLYALVEIEQATCLVQINAADGRVLWRQTLLRSERNEAGRLPASGVAPTVGDGLVYCPTGRGAIAAVDPLRREIAWIHYLRVNAKEAGKPRQNGLRGFRGRSWDEESEAWRQCRVVEHGGRLAVVSTALPTLEMLDSRTGELAWTVKRKGGLLLAAVTDQAVLTVDVSGVTAHAIDDGTLAWRAAIPSGLAPVGEGLLLDDGYLLPLRSGIVASISTAKGESKDRLRLIPLSPNRLNKPTQLGDLMYHQAAIYSHSATSVECYPQRAGPYSPLDEVELLLAKGNHNEAKNRLAKLPPASDRQEAKRAASARLRLLQRDPDPSLRDLAELRTIPAGSQAAATATLAEVRAAIAHGEPLRAAEAVVDLASGPAAECVLTPAPGWRAEAICLAAAALRRGVEEQPLLLSQAINSSDNERARDLATRRLERFRQAATEEQPFNELYEEPTAMNWSLKQVQATTVVEPETAVRERSTRRSRPGSQPGTISLQLTNGRGGRLDRQSWWIEPRDGSSLLVGANANGERVFSEQVSVDTNTRVSTRAVAVGERTDRLGAGCLALRLDVGYGLYDTTAERDGDRLLWSSTQRDSPEWSADKPAEGGVEAPVAIGPWGVVSITDASLVCRHTATGRRCWTRTLGSIGAGPYRVLATTDDLFVAGRGDRGIRLSAWDGSTSEASWSLPPARTWLSRAGENLLVEGRSIAGRELRLIPIAAEQRGEPLWRREVPSDTPITVTDEGLLLLLSEKSDLVAIDLHEGVVRFTTELTRATEGPVRSLRGWIHAGRLFVGLDQSNPMANRGAGVSGLDGQPLLTGGLHCLDPKSGTACWAGPARIAAMARLRTPVRDSPVLLLGRREAAESEGGEETLSLVALDPATGATLVRRHDLPAGAGPRDRALLEVRRESHAGDSLLVHLGRCWIELRPTDRPASPRPPMVASVEDPLESKPKDLSRGFDRLIKSFFDDD